MFGSFNSTFGSTPSFGAPATGGFGAPSTTPTTGFGAPANTGFGAPTPAFGTPAPTTFGSTRNLEKSHHINYSLAFGQPAQPTGGFGGFGGNTFGSTQPAPTTFGQPTSTFGQPTQPTGGFGGFGATAQPAPTTFGQPTSTFGQPAQPTGFGSTMGSTFGSTPSTGMFGSTTATTGMFGSQPTPTASPFGTTTGSTFGTGGFGTTPNTASYTGVGTGNPPYKTSPDTDTGTNGQPLQHTAITAMPQYQNKTFEELRFEDYSSKKGQLGTGSTFGQPTAQPTTGFGTNPTAPTFGSTPTTTGFGQPTASTGGFGFGGTTTTQPSTGFGFGSTQPATTPGFGFGSTPAPTASPFGQPTTTQPSTGFGFGTTPAPTASPFGQPATNTFGSTTTQPSTGFGFGATATPSSPFGTAPKPTTTGFGFGTTPAPTTTPSFGGFGTTTPAPSTGGFGFGTTPAPSTGGFGFGTTPAPTLAAPTSTGFGFGTTPAPSTTGTGGFGFGGFGTTPTTGSTTTSLFGPSSTSFAPTTTTPSFSYTPATPGGSNNFGFGTTPGMMGSTMGTTGKTTSITSPSPYGTVPPPMAPAVVQPSITPVTPNRRVTPMTPNYRVTPKSSAKIKPRGYPGKQSKNLFEEAPPATPDFFVTRQSIKKLNIEPDEETAEMPKTPGGSFLMTPSRIDVNMSSPQATPLAPRTPLDSSHHGSRTPLTASLLKPVRPVFFKEAPPIKTLTALGGDKSHSDDLNELPSLTREGYFTVPDLKSLSQMQSEELSNVDDFVIGLKNVGFVQYLEPVDVRGLDLDSIIEFSTGEIVVYPDEHNKPEVGQGINKPARVTLEHLWPRDRDSNRRKMDEDSLSRYEQKIKKSTEKLGARFLAYDRKTGNWVFEVEHFSRYGLLDDDSDDEEVELPPAKGLDPVSPNNRYKLQIEDSDEETEESEEQNISEEEINTEEMILPETEFVVMGNEDQRLPEQLGLDPVNIQSFLFDDTLTSKRKSLDTTEGGFSDAFPRDFSRFTPKKNLFETPERPLPLQPLYPEITPKSLPVSDLNSHIPYSTSISFSSQRSHADKSFFMGRSFRVGWGPNGTLLHSGNPVGKGKNGGNRLVSMVTVEQVFVVPVSEENIAQQYIPLLEEHMNCSEPQDNIDGVPTFALTQVFQNLKNNILQLETASLAFPVVEHSKLVFQLVSALWGQDTSADEIFRGHDIQSDENYAENIARRLALNYWLKNTVQPTIAREVTSGLDAIFSHMTGKQISEAALKAMEQKDYKMATLIAQSCSNGPLRSDMKFQLESWSQNGILEKIPEKRVSIYRLLSGDVNSVSSHLDWKRAFAMQFWYGSANNAAISQVIENYDRSFSKNSCRGPVPNYIEGVSTVIPNVSYAENSSTIAVTENGDMYTWNDQKEYFKCSMNGQWSKITDISELKNSRLLSVTPIGLDTNYHLLKLRADQTYDLWRVISPTGVSPFSLDYRLSWHLFSVLMSLGYQPFHGYHSVFTNYAFQLENAGLWHWAIYVLLNLPEGEFSLKSRAIREILGRHAPDIQFHEEFLVQKLQIPIEWIDEAKSYFMSYSRDLHSEIYYVLQSAQWNKGHELVLNVLAPELILKGDFDELFGLLEKLAEHYKEISDWELGGSVYYDYIRLSRDIKNCVAMTKNSSTLNSAINSIPHLEELTYGLSKRLAAFINKREHEICDIGDKKRLSEKVCLSDMSAQLAQYLKELYKLTSSLRGEETETVQLTSSLVSADLTEDYKLLHLRELHSSFLRKICSY